MKQAIWQNRLTLTGQTPHDNIRTMWRIVLVVALVLSGALAAGQDYYPGAAPPGPAATPPWAAPGSPVVPPPSGPPPGWPAIKSPPGPDLGRPAAPVFATPAVPAQPAPPVVVPGEKLMQSTWYTRVDYFHWNERMDGFDFVNESGPLFTLGYMRRVGSERYRLELFGGDVHYDGYGQFDDGLEPLSSTTRYLGLRGEYDLLFGPSWWSHHRFVLGVGTRFWIRDMKDDVTAWGDPVAGYQETWWTIYPYFGLEGERPLPSGAQLYGSMRVGATPLTYERASLFDVTLYPRCGVLGQAELGFRGEHFFLAGSFEAFTWRQSATVRDVLQPDSVMLTVGLKGGWTF